MKVTKHYSLVHAEKILRAVTKEVRLASDENELEVRLLANGREQGFVVTQNHAPRRGVCFARIRNGDSIVVCKGNASDFDDQTGVPFERLYRDAFEHDHAAVTSIVAYLTAKRRIRKTK